MPNLVSLEKVSKSYAEKVLLDEVSVGIDEGDRVGVIGANGSGKSTLLRLLAGVEEPDSGRVVRSGTVQVSYLEQDPRFDGSASPLQVVLPAAREAALGLGWDVEARARAVLDRLGVADVEDAVGHRSGGQRKRIALARALVASEGAAVGNVSPLLILDEPTNHLDVDVVEWLESELRGLSGTLVLVTHDRYVLDRVTTRIIELHRGALHTAHGSYGAYLEARALREEQELAAERKRENLARIELDWLRRGPKARTSKAKYRVERAHQLLDAETAELRQDVVIDLPSRRIGGKVVNLHNVGKSFGGRRVLHGVDHKLSPSDRIGIVGPNGSGKTTLLNIIAGRLEPDEGKVSTGETVVMGYFGQEFEPPPPGQRVLEAVKEVVLETNTVDGINLSAAQLLERFLFTSEAQKAFVSELSGGERRRLELLRVLGTAPNLLLLDEPTNDLDLDTLGVLESYLDTWPGALVVASHDRYFLDRVCGHLFSIEPDGSVRHHPGGWTAYRLRQAEQARRADEARKAARRTGGDRDDDPPGGARAGKLTYNEQRELRRLERRIPQLEARREELTTAMQDAGGDYEKAAAFGEELHAVIAELDAAESRWLELSLITEET
jgi:ABC transport system ATP-binding/permease protein